MFPVWRMVHSKFLQDKTFRSKSRPKYYYRLRIISNQLSNHMLKDEERKGVVVYQQEAKAKMLAEKGTLARPIRKTTDRSDPPSRTQALHVLPPPVYAIPRPIQIFC